MKQKRFNVEQIVAVLNQAEAEVPLGELIRRVGISERTFYRWKKQYAGLEPSTKRWICGPTRAEYESLAAISLGYKQPKTHSRVVTKVGPINDVDSLTRCGTKTRAGQYLGC